MFNTRNVVFKDYNPNQLLLLPPSLESLIPSGHLVRTVSTLVDQMDITPLLRTYQGGGTSSYHPKMMLKVLLYSYTQKVYSCRQIAKALRENVHFMWLSGMQQPDFRTINLFRGERMKDVIEQIFSSLVELLADARLIDLKDYFVDGTQIEANANRYTFVWAGSTEKYKSSLQRNVRALLNEIDKINEEEDLHHGSHDLAEVGEQSQISSEMLERKVAELDAQLSQKSERKKKPPLKKAIKKIRKDYLPRLRKYEEQEKTLNGRRSYSKTDPDATFMRMKDDHMKNGQLKAGYNVQMGTQNQFVLSYTIHQKSNDTTHLIPHLEHFQDQFDRLPKRIIADAGYGSEENYTYLASNKTQAYVKFSYFHWEQKRKIRNDPFRPQNWEYDHLRNEYPCPEHRKLSSVSNKKRKTRTGFEQHKVVYQTDCSDCPLKEKCNPKYPNKRIEVNQRLERYKSKARRMLKSEEGKILRSKRPIEVEAVFGQIKHNMGLKRFSLRGIEKVNLEYGLFAMAHNLKKAGRG